MTTIIIGECPFCGGEIEQVNAGRGLFYAECQKCLFTTPATRTERDLVHVLDGIAFTGDRKLVVLQ